MKMVLEVPDTSTCIGLFLNFQTGGDEISTTAWLAPAKDGKTFRVDGCGKVTEREG